MGSTMWDTVHLMATYNRWANEIFGQYFAQYGDDILAHPLPGSFPSVGRTLLHIWDAQDIWYQRLHGRNPVAFRNTYRPGMAPEIFEGLRQTSQAYVDLVGAANGTDLDEVVEYVTISSGQQSSRRYEILLHVFNHSMYHRGQCIVMARALNLDNIPSTDLIRFLRLKTS